MRNHISIVPPISELHGAMYRYYIQKVDMEDPPKLDCEEVDLDEAEEAAAAQKGRKEKGKEKEKDEEDGEGEVVNSSRKWQKKRIEGFEEMDLEYQFYRLWNQIRMADRPSCDQSSHALPGQVERAELRHGFLGRGGY